MIIIAGERFKRLTSIGAELTRGGVDSDLAKTLVRSFNTTNCNPPLPEAEVNVICDCMKVRST